MSEGAQIVKPTIAQIFSEFLAEQERRLSGRSLSQYGQVVGLLKTSLNNYGYQGLCAADAERFDRLYKAQGEEHREFCEIFGAEHILLNLREFLGYFMVRKVIAGAELLRAAGTVTQDPVKVACGKGLYRRGGRSRGGGASWRGSPQSAAGASARAQPDGIR